MGAADGAAKATAGAQRTASTAPRLPAVAARAIRRMCTRRGLACYP